MSGGSPSMDTTYRTRIAPSPTGNPHLGTFRTGYFNWLAARQNPNGKFFIRIDDTDTERNVPGADTQFINIMEWLGLDWDGLFFQSKHFEKYKHYVQILLDGGYVKTLENGAIALNLDEDQLPDSWEDTVVGQVRITDKDKELISKLILFRGNEKGNLPLYHFTSIVDDWNMDINFIIRGSDHITNTTKQFAIWRALQLATGKDTPFPKTAHIGLIHFQKKKLSKRDGAASMDKYYEEGYDPDAMLNFMLRLGWGPTVDDKSTAVLTKEDALRLFISGGNMRSPASNMDLQKLESFNRKFKSRKEKNGKNT